MMKEFDLIIIGGGPAGYNAAERAAANGLKVMLVEKDRLGGTCLNAGCIPSKVFINSAKLYEQALSAKSYGVDASAHGIDHEKVVARKKSVVSKLVSGVGTQLSSAGVEVICDSGYITGRTDNGIAVNVGEQSFLSKNLLICTGASALLPGIPGLEEAYHAGYVLTNSEIFDLPKIPESLVIIGGGVIGIEMATYFNAAGAKVTIVEALDHIVGDNDDEICRLLLGDLKKAGIEVKLSTTVERIEGKQLSCVGKDGQRELIACEQILCAVGRKPRIDDFGLENLHVYTERGAIVTDERMRTNVPGVYAAGDVNGKTMLASTAYREGEVAVNNICGTKDRMNYSHIPSLIYSLPEVAAVGYTQSQAKKQGINAKCVKTSLLMSGRYMAENEKGKGFCKLVIDADKNTLIGVHIIGGYAAENIYAAALLLDTQLDVSKAQKTVFPHPTVVEVIREGLFA